MRPERADDAIERPPPVVVSPSPPPPPPLMKDVAIMLSLVRSVSGDSALAPPTGEDAVVAVAVAVAASLRRGGNVPREFRERCAPAVAGRCVFGGRDVPCILYFGVAVWYRLA